MINTIIKDKNEKYSKLEKLEKKFKENYLEDGDFEEEKLKITNNIEKLKKEIHNTDSISLCFTDFIDTAKNEGKCSVCEKNIENIDEFIKIVINLITLSKKKK
jgi:hypothetical protein